jgi:phosphoglucosamine mutase
LNINAGCGATHLDDVRTAVVRHGADAGFAHDGDADRCLAVDASGQLVDGDQLLALLAVAMRGRGHSARRHRRNHRDGKPGVQPRHAARAHSGPNHQGGRPLRAPGHARARLLARRRAVGHFILLDHATTGDGVLTALHVLARVSGTGASLAELAAVMTRCRRCWSTSATSTRHG